MITTLIVFLWLHSYILNQALNQWVDLMDQSLTGKKKAAAKCWQKKWKLSPDEWGMLEKLCSVLEVIFALIGDFDLDSR